MPSDRQHFSISQICYLENMASKVTEAGKRQAGVFQEMVVWGQVSKWPESLPIASILSQNSITWTQPNDK